MPICVSNVATQMGELAPDIDPRSVISLSDYGSDIDFDDVDEDTILANVLDTIRRKANFGDVNKVFLNEAEDPRDGNHRQDVDISTQLSTMVAVATRTRKAATVDVQSSFQSPSGHQPDGMEVDCNKTSRQPFTSKSGHHRNSSCACRYTDS